MKNFHAIDTEPMTRNLSLTLDGETLEIPEALVTKYSQPGPRYTSYPTAPNWLDNFGPSEMDPIFARSKRENNPLSLYFHIPFCEERCTFCACNVVATPQHEVAIPYLKALQQEINRVAEKINVGRPLVQLHLGGGTPTYLSPHQLEDLMQQVTDRFSFSKETEISIEIDPRVTTDEHLAILKTLGFNRISLGVQDFEPAVQQAIGRVQLFTRTQHVIEFCRQLGFQSINCDLVYGLPLQTRATFTQTLSKLLQLSPDRIALFNFAYVPWLQAHQRKIDAATLPDAWTKLEMFAEAVRRFQETDYSFIGLDHFAKKNDPLVEAKKSGGLHRNFQGYTTRAGADLIGLGVTAIGHLGGAFVQNAHKLIDYEKKIAQEGLATERGFLLSEDDQRRAWILSEIFCHQEIRKKKFQEKFGESFDALFADEIDKLEKFEEEEILFRTPDAITLTPKGRLFLRNVAMVFDAYLAPNQTKFSKTL